MFESKEINESQNTSYQKLNYYLFLSLLVFTIAFCLEMNSCRIDLQQDRDKELLSWFIL